MAKLFGKLGVTQAQKDEVKAEEVYEGFLIPSGVHDAELASAFIRTTDKGANMLELEFKLADDKTFKWSTCTQSGDEKGNKTTYTAKNGREVNLPGVEQMTKLLIAIGVPDPEAHEDKVQFGDNEIDALCIDGIQGKKLKLGVTQYENEYNGEVNLKNEIKYFMDESGVNNKGENILESVTADIEKKPVKKLKVSAATGATPPAAEAAPAGWGS